MKLLLTDFSLKRPWLVVLFALLATVLFAWQFPKVTFDNDPENMLAEDEHVRVFHHQVKEKYSLYDFVVVGIVNEANPDGVFNVATLQRIDDLTQQLLNLRQGPEGQPRIARPGEEPRRLNLQPESSFERLLNRAFNHDPNDLFDDQGRSVIIDRELIAPSVVDSLEQAELGSLKLEYLMEEVPTTRAEALTLRDTALGNPLYAGTLASEDGRAIALYLPIKAKIYSHNVANLVQTLTADWPAEDQVYITGLPVAEDTFGIEMLVQMATSAPLAGLVIFLLLLFFFRKPTLIVAPMVVAVVSVVCTMGLLIGLGFDVHIMSSMIAIFLMPIAVADSVHILSEFYDSYHRFSDKGKTVRQVISHLFRPMLFTSLTTMAGFASLAMTPIPPVRVFGLHVAFGVGLAWLLSMTLIPAYIMLAVPESQLQSLSGPQGTRIRSGLLNRVLEALGRFSYQRWRLIIAVTLLVVAVSVFGISLIQVNDNPVKWFTKNHRIRVADRVLNEHFGGTYTAYLTLRAVSPEACNCDERAEMMKSAAQERFGQLYPAATRKFIATLDDLKQRYDTLTTSDTRKVFVELVKRAEQLDQQTSQPWSRLAEEIYYLEPQGLDLATLKQALGDLSALPQAVREELFSRLSSNGQLEGAALHEAALKIADRHGQASFAEFVYQMEAELTAPLFKQPRMLRYVDRLEDYVTRSGVVGKTNSAVDALKKAAYELNYREPPNTADAARTKELQQRNESFFAVPETASAVGQVFVQLEGTKKKDSLFHLVTRDYQEANLWFQLVSGDNQDMERVVAMVDEFLQQNPPPTELYAEWAGLTYLNVVWQDKMVRGMINSLVGSFIVVMVMMMLLFRSVLYGILAMLPLSVTITAIYGIIGLIGKDYDMPVGVLSALTLGLSVDFAIHFLQRARDLQAECGSWQQASTQMFKEPAMAISRNAIIIAVGFIPLLVAPLVPYRTVGFFLATIMVVSWLATLFILPALLTPLRRLAFGEQTVPAKNVPKGD
jgi:predicted RND superfamily exporter protein